MKRLLMIVILMIPFAHSNEQTTMLSTQLKKDIIDVIPGFLNQMQIYRESLKNNKNNVTNATSQYLENQAPSWLNLSKKELDKLKNYKPQVKNINDLFGVIKQTAELPGIVVKVKKGLNSARTDLANLKPMFNNLAGTVEFIGDIGEDLESLGASGSDARQNMQELFSELKSLAQTQPAKLNALGIQLKAFITEIDTQIKQLIKNINSLDIKDIKNSATKLMNIKADSIINSVKSLNQTKEYNSLIRTITSVDFDAINKNKAKIKEELNTIKESL